jgi:hypothetical protein
MTQDTSSKNQGGRPKLESIKITREARQRLDTLAAENADDLFQAILGAALAGDMAAARILADRIWPNRRGAPITFTPPMIKKPEDLPDAYAWLLAEVSEGRLTPDEGALIDAMIERRGKAFETVVMAQEIADLRARIDSLYAGGKIAA